LFDYMSNLIEYCCSGKEKGVFKWTKLSRAVRGKGNPLCGLEISTVIDRIDRTFVGRLYDHRSFVIHERSSMPKTTSSIDIINEEYSSKYIAPKKLIDRFSELRSLSKEYNFSLEYILIWIVNKTIDSIEEIMFGLKETMELNKKYESGFFFFKDENGEFLAPSTPYWRGYKKRNYCQQRV
jgi:hypothetical protein